MINAALHTAKHHSDFGTPELHKREEMVITGGRMGKKTAMRRWPHPLDYYLNRGWISEAQYKAGMNYGRAFVQAGKMPRTTGRYEKEIKEVRTFGTVEDELNFARDADREWSEAEAAIGAPDRNVLLDVCCLEKYISMRHADSDNWRIIKKEKESLLRGLDALVVHYKGVQSARRLLKRHKRLNSDENGSKEF